MEIVAVKAGAQQQFSRATETEARSLAAELEKEGYSISIDGDPFLNSAGPNGLYLHQSNGSCPLCRERIGCARCSGDVGEIFSVKPTHYHSRHVDGVPGHAGVHDVLCYECHRKDRFEVYGEGYGEAVA